MVPRIEKLLIALTVAALAATAMAGETISYTYDARGRLVKAVRTGSVNNNVSATYSYDKADNRTNVNVVSPNSPPPP
jgi:YD repeat-containing protein